MKLSALLQGIKYDFFFGDWLVNVVGITDDSRKVKKDFLFIAVEGLTVDGHSFIPEAIKRGACAIICERLPQKKHKKGKVVYIRVSDSRQAMGEVASNYFKKPSQKLKVIGITGTKGKTTTAYFIYQMLSALGKKVGIVSTISAKIGAKNYDTGFHVTNPDCITLHRLLNEMVKAGCQYAVLEVSSHGIDQQRIAGVEFLVGVLTNIAPEHLDYHKTFREYKRVKMEFLKSCKIKIISPKIPKIAILPGIFNNLNADAAVDTIAALGLGRQKALSFVKRLRLPPGRLEEVKNKLGIKIIIDFAHTPDSFENVLAYLRSITTGRLIAVFGSAGERDPYKRPKMGKITSQLADIVILTAEDPRSERVSDINAQIKSGIAKQNMNKVFEVSDRPGAIEYAIKSAVVGDTIAFLGKGHEKSMNLGGKGETVWSELAQIKEALKKI